MVRDRRVVLYNSNRRAGVSDLVRRIPVTAARVAARVIQNAYRQYAKRKAEKISMPVKKRSRNASRMRVLPTRRRRLVYHTRGYRGRPLGRLRRVRVPKVRRDGTQSQLELGGVASNPDVVYLGHAVPGYTLYKEVARALIKRLFMKAGINIVSMGDKIQDHTSTWVISPGDIVLGYRATSNSQLQTSVTGIAADATFGEAAATLWSAMNTVIGAAGTLDALTFEFVSINAKDRDGTIDGFNRCRIVLTNATLTIGCVSILHMQNRTLAGAATTTDQSNMLDVANNPLDGVCYSGRGVGCTPKFVDQTAAALGSSWFYGGNNAGNILVLPTAAGNWTPEMLQNYKRPPTASAFQGVSRTSRVHIAPGEIKTSTTKFMKTLPFNTYILQNYKALAEYQGGGNVNPWHSLGWFKMFGFEKRCNTGSDEPDISVGYEYNVYTSASVSEKPTYTIRDWIS